MAYFPNPYQTVYPYQQIQQVPQIPQTKMIEVIQVDSIEEAGKWQVQTGASVLFFARDDSFNAVKSVEFNGKETFVVFDRRREVPAPAFMTREDVETMIAAAMKKPARKEAPAE